jgi:hypothetical protein
MSFELCCKPFIEGIKNAPTAEHPCVLGIAVCYQAADYLVATIIQREKIMIEKQFCSGQLQINGFKLGVITTTTKVAFKAYYPDHNKNLKYIRSYPPLWKKMASGMLTVHFLNFVFKFCYFCSQVFFLCDDAAEIRTFFGWWIRAQHS